MARISKVKLDLNTDNLEWIKTSHPGISITALLNLLLQKFRDVSDRTPDYYAKLAASELKKEIKNG